MECLMNQVDPVDKLRKLRLLFRTFILIIPMKSRLYFDKGNR